MHDTIVVLLFYNRGDSHSPHVICKVRLKKMDLPKRVFVFSYLSIHRLYVDMFEDDETMFDFAIDRSAI